MEVFKCQHYLGGIKPRMWFTGREAEIILFRVVNKHARVISENLYDESKPQETAEEN